MKSKRYYWTLAILALLFVFVVLADVIGFIGLFTGGKAKEEDASAGAVVTVSAPGELATSTDVSGALGE